MSHFAAPFDLDDTLHSLKMRPVQRPFKGRSPAYTQAVFGLQRGQPTSARTKLGSASAAEWTAPL
jgi:hypothetical protein